MTFCVTCCNAAGLLHWKTRWPYSSFVCWTVLSCPSIQYDKITIGRNSKVAARNLTYWAQMELSQSQRKNNIYYKERGLCYDKPDTRWRKWSRKGGVGGEKAIKKKPSFIASRWVGGQVLILHATAERLPTGFASNSRPTLRKVFQLPSFIFLLLFVLPFLEGRNTLTDSQSLKPGQVGHDDPIAWREYHRQQQTLIFSRFQSSRLLNLRL